MSGLKSEAQKYSVIFLLFVLWITYVSTFPTKAQTNQLFEKVNSHAHKRHVSWPHRSAWRSNNPDSAPWQDEHEQHPWEERPLRHRHRHYCHRHRYDEQPRDERNNNESLEAAEDDSSSQELESSSKVNDDTHTTPHWRHAADHALQIGSVVRKQIGAIVEKHGRLWHDRHFKQRTGDTTGEYSQTGDFEGNLDDEENTHISRHHWNNVEEQTNEQGVTEKTPTTIAIASSTAATTTERATTTEKTTTTEKPIPAPTTAATERIATAATAQGTTSITKSAWEAGENAEVDVDNSTWNTISIDIRSGFN